MKEFSRETMAYFKSHARPEIVSETPSDEKLETSGHFDTLLTDSQRKAAKVDVIHEEENEGTEEGSERAQSINANENPLATSVVDEGKIAKVIDRKHVLEEFTFLKDLAEIPVTNEILDWSLFNVDFMSTDRDFK
jgi:hypothetical protein